MLASLLFSGASFAIGLFHWPWWAIIITSVGFIAGVNLTKRDVTRVPLRDPIGIIWAAIPQFFLWGVGWLVGMIWHH